MYQERDGYVLVPRHYLDYSKHNVRWIGPESYPLLTETCTIAPFGRSEGERNIQQEAFDFLADYCMNPAEADSIVSLRCGGGKTCIALRGAFDLGYHFIILAHTTDILLNWKEELLQHTSVKEEDIGEIISGTFNLKPITLALIPSVLALSEDRVDAIRHLFGTVIVDECHHMAAEAFSKVSSIFSGRRIGLSATLAREDGLSFVYYLAFGKKLFFREIRRKKAEVFLKRIDADADDMPDNYAQATSRLSTSKTYLETLAADIREGYRQQHKQLIVSTRKEMLYSLQGLLADLDPGINIRETPATERQVNLRTKRIVLSIDRYGKEGLNEPSLTQLRVVTPVKDPNAIVQMVGRLERGDTIMQAFFYAANYVPFLKTLHKAKEALVRHQYLVKEA